MLLLGCASIGAAIRIVTVFTIAHSVTLALAVFEIVSVPAAVVEPIIAASIVYVALARFLPRARAGSEPLLAVLLFGLVHGLGFAGALGELLPAGGVTIPLLAFNLGVEAGQIGLTALVLPCLLRLARGAEPTWFTRFGVPATAGAAALLGMAWLLERTVA